MGVCGVCGCGGVHVDVHICAYVMGGCVHTHGMAYSH